MSCTIANGRLGNQIIRNLALSLIAKKHNLNVVYYNNELITRLGIELFCGNNKFKTTILLTDSNYISMYYNKNLDFNLNPNRNYFQTREITNILYKYLHTDIVKKRIIEFNPFKERYNKNNDLFVHIRLGDVICHNPGIDYYVNTIKTIHFDNLYISTDSKDHDIIKKIINLYPNTILVNYDEIKTFQFGSTCKNVLLSHGSFSAVIGFLSFFSNVYYPNKNPGWCPLEMFEDKSWNAVTY